MEDWEALEGDWKQVRVSQRRGLMRDTVDPVRREEDRDAQAEFRAYGDGEPDGWEGVYSQVEGGWWEFVSRRRRRPMQPIVLAKATPRLVADVTVRSSVNHGHLSGRVERGLQPPSNFPALLAGLWCGVCHISASAAASWHDWEAFALRQKPGYTRAFRLSGLYQAWLKGASTWLKGASAHGLR